MTGETAAISAMTDETAVERMFVETASATLAARLLQGQRKLQIP
jgi:hypothetical protein